MDFRADYSLAGYSTPAPVNYNSTTSSGWADFLSGISSTVQAVGQTVVSVAQTVAQTDAALDSTRDPVTPAPVARPPMTLHPLVAVGLAVAVVFAIKKLAK